jgi:serine/threonine protein kinase/tetratricopeptide (TPR) repeat protein
MTLHDRWAEVRRLFDEASGRDATERDAFLETATDDETVRAEVRSLLQWDASGTEFLNTPAALLFGHAAPAAAPASLIDATLGPWRIVGKIGQGGMGVVYRAVRADAAFEREVALKVVGLAPTSAALDRFRLERETLARLDHPAIARLLDGGTTPEGHPYFVMELVDGVPIDRFCDDQRLGVGGRLGAFLRVCAGVQYAHQNLIVHRDLKPDNILVLADGHPKLLDFGVAKLVSDDASLAGDDSLLRSTQALTPEYGAPEQAAGEPITAAADVYSLGVLLHVMLTGTLPRRVGPGVTASNEAVASVAPASRVVLEGADAPARAASRRGTPRALARALRGDLDAIIAKALAWRPGDRYATVAELARDVERHRENRPVQARPRRPLYVVGSFVRRHTFGVGMSFGIVFIGLLALVSVAAQSAIASRAQARSERRFNELRELTRVFMFDVDDAIVNVPGTTRARELIVRTATGYLDRLANEPGSAPALRRELAAGFVKVGDVQGHPTSANLGNSAAARASYMHAITIGTQLVTSDRADVEAARTLALAHRRLADVLAWSGDKQDARVHAEESARQFALLAARPEATSEDRLQGAVGDIKMGDLLGNPNFPNLAEPAAALQHYDVALAALQAMSATSGDDSRVRRYLGIAYERIGTMHEQRKDWAHAADAYRASFRIRQALAASLPDHVEVQRDFAVAFEKLGNVAMGDKRPRVAIAHHRAALERFERLQRLDAQNAIAARSVAIAHTHLAKALLDAGARQEAVTHLRRALAIHTGLAMRDADNATAPCDAAGVADTLAAALTRDGEGSAGCEARRAGERLRQGVADRCGLDDTTKEDNAAALARCAGGARP